MTLKPLPKLLEQTQKVFNAYIRNRDQGKPCISCGSNQGNQAGHYFPVKGFSVLRFNEYNVNLQCAACNMYKHGNQAMYRIGLVQRIGEDQVVNLERIAVNERVKKWTRPELFEIINTYKNGKSD
jgi:hypothetical protein